MNLRKSATASVIDPALKGREGDSLDCFSVLGDTCMDFIVQPQSEG